jgi:hypothetical protein
MLHICSFGAIASVSVSVCVSLCICVCVCVSVCVCDCVFHACMHTHTLSCMHWFVKGGGGELRGKGREGRTEGGRDCGSSINKPNH